MGKVRRKQVPPRRGGRTPRKQQQRDEPHEQQQQPEGEEEEEFTVMQVCEGESGVLEHWFDLDEEEKKEVLHVDERRLAEAALELYPEFVRAGGDTMSKEALVDALAARFARPALADRAWITGVRAGFVTAMQAGGMVPCRADVLMPGVVRAMEQNLLASAWRRAAVVKFTWMAVLLLWFFSDDLPPAAVYAACAAGVGLVAVLPRWYVRAHEWALLAFEHDSAQPDVMRAHMEAFGVAVAAVRVSWWGPAPVRVVAAAPLVLALLTRFLVSRGLASTRDDGRALRFVGVLLRYVTAVLVLYYVWFSWAAFALFFVYLLPTLTRYAAAAVLGAAFFALGLFQAVRVHVTQLAALATWQRGALSLLAAWAAYAGALGGGWNVMFALLGLALLALPDKAYGALSAASALGGAGVYAVRVDARRAHVTLNVALTVTLALTQWVRAKFTAAPART